MNRVRPLSLLTAVAGLGLLDAFSPARNVIDIKRQEAPPPITLGPDTFPGSRNRSRSSRNSNARAKKKMADASRRANRRK